MADFNVSLLRIWAVAASTYREAIRNKVLYGFLFFAVMLIGSSLLMAQLSVGEGGRVVRDMGLASISLFSVAIAIFSGANLLYKEIQLNTIYSILSRPIRRYQFVLGKFLGLLLTLVVQLALMLLVLLAVVKMQEGMFDFRLLQAGVFVFFEVIIVTAIALLFSAFSTPFLSAMFTGGLFVMGRLSDDLLQLVSKTKSEALEATIRALYRVLPNLSNFSVADQLAHGIPLRPGHLGFAASYAVFYAAMVLLLAAIIFEKRDFK